MPSLTGNITINKRLLDHPVWERDPACYGRAWVDLIALANDAPRTTSVHGEAIRLARGQLAWSQRSLEKRWQRSDLWVKTFLNFCQDTTMIRLDVNRRRTIITIINYDVYNPPENGTDLDTDLEQKVESGIGIGNREGKPQQNEAFVEVPSEAEVLAFGLAYPGDLARGIPRSMPQTWVTDWFRYKARSGNLQKKWREKMTADFTGDFMAGHPKARALENKKLGGRSPAQARFELSRELEAVQARLDALYEVGAEASRRDQEREKELKKLIKEMS